jgi:hypothetical protein
MHEYHQPDVFKFTKAPATTPSGATSKMSSVKSTCTFQTLLATAFASGIAALIA